VIGHKTPGQQLDSKTLHRLAEAIDEGLVILGLGEQRHASVAAVEDVVN
jgi:hypothetical protein